jgi:hypothetical protein
VSDGDFALELPPLAEHLGTARSFSAAVARHFGVAGELVEDLKIAISEACIDALVTGERLRVDASGSGRALRFEVSAPEHQHTAPERDILDELGAPARIELIRALFADAEIDASDGHRVVRFSVPLP